MTGTPKRLCQAALTATPTVVYTAANDGKTAIIDIMATNTDSNQRGFYLYIGASAHSNSLFHNSKISSNDYLHIGQMYQIINAGESIFASSDATGVTLTISGLERI